MSLEHINIGATDNDGTGDPLRTALNKANQNFTEVFSTGTNAQAAAEAVANSAVAVNYVIDGGGAVIETGLKGYIQVPFAMWVTDWVLVADQSGTCVVDVVKSSGYAGFPTTSSIAGSEKPSLTGTQKNQDTDLTSWNRSIAAGDILGFNVDSADTVEILTVVLNGTKVA